MLSLKTRELSGFPVKLLLVLRTGNLWSLAVPLPAFSVLHGPAWCPCTILGHPGEVFLGDEGDVGFVPWVNGIKGGQEDTGPCSPCFQLYLSRPSVLQLHAQLPGCLGQDEHTRHWQRLQKSLFFAFKDGLIFYFFSNLLVCALPHGWKSSSFQPLC